MCDDMIIISRNLKALVEALEQLDNTAQEIGLIIKKKTKYMTVSTKTQECKLIAGG